MATRSVRAAIRLWSHACAKSVLVVCRFHVTDLILLRNGPDAIQHASHQSCTSTNPQFGYEATIQSAICAGPGPSPTSITDGPWSAFRCRNAQRRNRLPPSKVHVQFNHTDCLHTFRLSHGRFIDFSHTVGGPCQGWRASRANITSPRSARLQSFAFPAAPALGRAAAILA